MKALVLFCAVVWGIFVCGTGKIAFAEEAEGQPAAANSVPPTCCPSTGIDRSNRPYRYQSYHTTPSYNPVRIYRYGRHGRFFGDFYRGRHGGFYYGLDSRYRFGIHR